MIYLQLFFEFFKAGLFSFGGGLSVIPFLYEMTGRYDWITRAAITDMIAVAEAAPGSLGINLAAYAGYQAGGFAGGLTATVAFVLPAFIIAVAIASVFAKFKNNRFAQGVFSALRPAAVGLIAFAAFEVVKISLFRLEGAAFSLTVLPGLLNFRAALLFAVLLFVSNKLRWHPIFYIAAAAAVGAVFKF
ncbi:MAG: chromate transporter [Clostridiales bacterium]|nr:chromate transporter [Clostridiales bacterium]